MGAYTLVAVFCKVVVPVGDCRRFFGCQRQCEHRHGTGNVGLTGCRYASLAEHTHGDAGSTTEVLLQRVPTLYRHGIHLVCLYPTVYGNAELALQTQLLPV